MLRPLIVGIVLALALSSFVLAIHTAETRYSVDQTTIEQRNIYNVENRYGSGYVKPFGGYGMKGASSGSLGQSGVEEGASILATNSFIARGRNPGAISNYYASARGYQITNKYVELKTTGSQLTMRPQINGTPEGHARIISKKPNQLYLPQLTVQLRTRDLVPLARDYIYEAWLVDEDTAYSMSLGIFQPSEIGRIGTLSHISTHSADSFESIIVTVEPFPDTDPRPGQVVLAGDLEPKVVRAQ